MTDGEWSAIIPADSATVPGRIVFVDGVRRLEARVHARQGEQLIYGGFGSHAVGAVEVGESDSRGSATTTLGTCGHSTCHS